MTHMNLKILLAVATIGASAGVGHSANAAAYHERKETQLAEQLKALSKKQRVREQIRARRKVLK